MQWLRDSFPVIVTFCAWAQASAVEPTDVLTRSLMSSQRDATVQADPQAPGFSIVDISWTREESFINTTGNAVVTIESIETIALDPADVGISDIFGAPTLPPTNLFDALDAAASLHPEVHFWGINWDGEIDPQPVEWQPPANLPPSGFPVVLGPGEAVGFTTVTSASANRSSSDTALEFAELIIGYTITGSVASGLEGSVLQAGDADRDFDFDQRDLVQVQIAATYLTGKPATWGEGDWNGAPGGNPGSPPAGDRLFNQLDVVAAQQAGIYLTGPYAAVRPDGRLTDGQTSIVYDAATGEVAVDAPAGRELTSINVDSTAAIFTADAATNLGGSFDNDADNNIFKATFGSSFGSLSFGTVAMPGLSVEFLLNDLTVIGSLDGGGALGEVDLVYVPEPATAVLASLAFLSAFRLGRRHHRTRASRLARPS